jgi:diadenosine tetraphosphatase ApaH/serine/threonine PP2A family protein phosphatase
LFSASEQGVAIVSRLALLYDIHGNLPALEAVLEDARAAGAGRFVFGGDYALFGPYPAETVAVLRGVPDAGWIRGNVDRWTAHPDDVRDDQLIRGAIADCREALDASVVEQLGTLAEQLVRDGTLFCHASPVSDMLSFMPEPEDGEDELLEGISEQRVVFGHTHIAFRRTRPDATELINPGSVGMPFDGDNRAAYAIVHEDDRVEHRRVGYDVEAAVSALVERYGDAPWARRSVHRLRSAAP